MHDLLHDVCCLDTRSSLYYMLYLCIMCSYTYALYSDVRVVSRRSREPKVPRFDCPRLPVRIHKQLVAPTIVYPWAVSLWRPSKILLEGVTISYPLSDHYQKRYGGIFSSILLMHYNELDVQFLLYKYRLILIFAHKVTWHGMTFAVIVNKGTGRGTATGNHVACVATITCVYNTVNNIIMNDLLDNKEHPKGHAGLKAEH